MDTYSYVMPNMQQEAAQKLDNFLFADYHMLYLNKGLQLGCKWSVSHQTIKPKALIFGREGGIRTHGTREGTAVFKTAAFNHSATHPSMSHQGLSMQARSTKSGPWHPNGTRGSAMRKG
jgi:hypothetical protein